MRIYLDAAPVIYTVEQVKPYAAAVDLRLSVPGVVRVASDLTRLECRVLPMRNGDADLLKEFDAFFEGVVAEVVSLSGDVIDYATEIRAKHAFKTPDAIHLADAVLSRCDTFLTNDHRLDQFKEIVVETIQP